MLRNTKLSGCVALLVAGVFIAQAGVATAAEIYATDGARDGSNLTHATLGTGDIAQTNASPASGFSGLGIQVYNGGTGVVFVDRGSNNPVVKHMSDPTTGPAVTLFTVTPDTDGRGDRAFSMDMDNSGNFYILGENGGYAGLFVYDSTFTKIGGAEMPSADLSGNTPWKQADIQIYNGKAYMAMGEDNSSSFGIYSVPVSEVLGGTYDSGDVTVELSYADVTGASITFNNGTSARARGLTFDDDGNLYVTTNRGQIIKKTTGGVITEFDNVADNSDMLYDIDFYDGQLYSEIGGATDYHAVWDLDGTLHTDPRYTGFLMTNLALPFESDGASAESIPEPSTLILGLLSLFGFGLVSRRGRRQR